MVKLVSRATPFEVEIEHMPFDGGDPQNSSLHVNPFNESPLILTQILIQVSIGKLSLITVSDDVSEPRKK